MMKILSWIKNKMNRTVQKRLIRKLLFVRLSGSVDEDLWKLTWKHVKGLSDIDLYGTPEATIALLLQTYWGYKKRGDGSDSEIFVLINEARRVAHFPLGVVRPGMTLDDYIIDRVRLEAPECHTKQKISDEHLVEIIAMASTEVRKLLFIKQA